MSFLFPKEGFILNEKVVLSKWFFFGTLIAYPKPKKLLLKDSMRSNDVLDNFSEFSEEKLTYKEALLVTWYFMFE